MEYRYKSIKELAKLNNSRVIDYLVLAPQNDPFYVGRPSELRDAKWFADLWSKHGFGDGVHLRRIHYALVSQREPVKLPRTVTGKNKETGKKFETDEYINNYQCWEFMLVASKHARYLNLVPAGAFVDQRAPAIKEHALGHTEHDGVEKPEYGATRGARIFDLAFPPLPERPRFYTEGYNVVQNYHVEIWVEKTTMDDVLAPLCTKYGVNLVTGAGHMSISFVIDYLKRLRTVDKPGRILYVSDYDPAGLDMPIGVARKVEFYQRQEGYGDLDIKLDPIALTPDQVEQHDLPTAPDGWTVELDALEALYPNLLAEIAEKAILHYYDDGLWDRVNDAQREMQEVLANHERRIADSYKVELDEIDQKYARLKARYESEIAALKEQVGVVYDVMYESMREVEIPVKACPEPEVEGDPPAMMYESGRDYEDQLRAYNRQKNDNGG